jgi:hypothetical protein
MTSSSRDGGGSFRELRERHLGLFGHHHRPDPSSVRSKSAGRLEQSEGKRTHFWKSFRIFRVRTDQGEE